MSDFEDKLMEWVDSQSLTAGVRGLLLAVSGGADSVAMACALHALRQAGRLSCELAIGHVNHQLRGADSDADEAFVSDLADRLRLPFRCGRVHVRSYAAQHKLSIETAARVLRLDVLVNQCQALHCDAIATAHHMDDQAETIVHRLKRGTGFRGLCGIRPRSQLHGIMFIRPMLSVRRDEIASYCMQNAVEWRDDATNDSLEPARNRIRHVLLPEMRKRWPNITQGLFGLSNECRRMQERIEAEAQTVLSNATATHQENTISLHRQLLVDCPPWIFYEVMREVLVQLGIGLRDYTQPHFEKMRALTERGLGSYQFPAGIRLRAKKKTITMEHISLVVNALKAQA